MNVQQYLTKRFTESKWPYHGVNTMFYELQSKATKDELRAEIRELRKLGYIDIVGGINEWLIKIIDESKFLN